MTTIDPRLVARRLEVREVSAQRQIGRLAKLLMTAALLGLAAWVLQSPIFDIDTINVEGVSASNAEAILVEHSLTPGYPIVKVRAAQIENALLADPWIKQAEVTIDLPDRVDVVITERTPAAWVEFTDGWALMSEDAVLLGLFPEPDPSLPRVVKTLHASTTQADSLLTGGLQFLANLDAGLTDGTKLWTEGGELWASIDRFKVRLGRPTLLSEKAAALAAVLSDEHKSGSEINLLSPTRPAVSFPTPKEEKSEAK